MLQHQQHHPAAVTAAATDLAGAAAPPGRQHRLGDGTSAEQDQEQE